MKFQKLRPEKKRRIKISKGIILKKEPLIFLSNSSEIKTLTNIYEIEINENNFNFDIISSLKPKYLKLFLRNKENSIAINAGFGYIVDRNFGKVPVDFTYNFHVINHQLINIPTCAKTALFSKDDKIYPVKIKPMGELFLNQTKISWIGSQTNISDRKDDSAIAFGLSNQGIIKYQQGEKLQIDFDPNYSFVPQKKGYKNVIFDLKQQDKKFVIYIKNITARKTSFFDGLFILSIPNKIAKKLNVNDKVTNWFVGGYSSQDIKNCVTIGIKITKSIKQLYQNIKSEKIIITRKPSGERYYSKIDIQEARACVFRTKNNKIHFLLVDARPKIFNQQGMSMADLSNYIYKKYNNIAWAVNCDGGQSAKICLKKGNKSYTYGNLHYIKFNKDGSINRWNGVNGRPVTSCIVATKIK